MKRYRISFRPRAQRDLFGLYDYIATQAGHEIAGAYIDRIESPCLSLESAPERGMRRDDIRRGLRIICFKRRVAIAFQIGKTDVVIVRIFYGGRNYERALRRFGESQERK
jgi:toxin ParE1/3/4